MSAALSARRWPSISSNKADTPYLSPDVRSPVTEMA